MENLISTILSNPIYLIITGLAIVIIIFLLIKKLFKILIYAFVLFIAFLTYIYLTGGSVNETIKDVKNKSREIINSNN
jgi:hypothetical protein